MLSARALFYSLVLMLFITSSSGLFIVSSQILNQQQTDQFHNLQARLNLNAGISLLKSGMGNSYGEKVPLYEEQIDSVFIQRYPWGLLDIGIASVETKSVLGKDTIRKIVSLGQAYGKFMEKALYLNNSNIQLSVAGNTSIIGNVAVPQGDIKKTAISGFYFNGTRPVDGSIEKSEEFLPFVNKERIDSILLLKSKSGESSISVSNIQQSFKDQVLVLNGEDVLLSGIDLSGKIIINASKTLTIASDCKLRNLLLFAPKIIIESGFSGNFQAYATKEIVVENDVLLTYPSVLCLTPDDQVSQEVSIKLLENSSIQGQILLYPIVPLRREPTLKIAQNAKVLGSAYIEGYTELTGEVIGNLITKKFLLNVGGSTYTNHLFNAKIDRNRLSSSYISPCVEKDITGYAIAQWLE